MPVYKVRLWHDQRVFYIQFMELALIPCANGIFLINKIKVSDYGCYRDN